MEDYSAFLSRAIDQSNNLQDLQTKVLVQIAKIFNITVDGSTHNQLNAKLKSKILDLFITQGQQYKDYLQLPKFKNMNPSTYQTILIIFNQIWKDANKFKQQSQLTQIQKQFNYLKPQLNSIMEIERFHIQLFENYRKSKLCPRKTQQIFIQKLNEKPFEFPFPPAVSQNYELKTKIQNIQDSFSMNNKEKQQINPIQINNNYDDTSYNRPIMNWQIMDQYARLRNQSPFNSELSSFRPNRFQNNFNNMIEQNQNFAQNSMVEEQEQEMHKNYFDIETQQVNQQFRQYMFINCYCQGKAKYQSWFQCEQCNFKIHYECFGKSEKDFLYKICPFCLLKLGNMFLIIEPNPLFESYQILKQGWGKLQIKFSLSTINEIKKILKQNQKSQKEVFLRFLKCSGRKSKPNNNNDSKLDCIPIPKSFLQNLTPQKSLLININASNQNQNEKEKIFVLGLFFQRNKTAKQHQDELLNNKEQSTDEEYLEKLREATQEKMITLNIIDNSSGEKIVLPVRGDKCVHPQVFDYRHFLQLVRVLGKQSQKNMECDKCGEKITNFLIDNYVLKKLSQIPKQSLQQNGKKIIGIIYKGKQDFQWKYEQQVVEEESIDDNSSGNSQQNLSLSESQS